MQDVTLASASSTAALTLGLSTYAALILVSIAVAIAAARRGQRRRALIASAVVGLLTLAGLVIAIISSIA